VLIYLSQLSGEQNTFEQELPMAQAVQVVDERGGGGEGRGSV